MQQVAEHTQNLSFLELFGNTNYIAVDELNLVEAKFLLSAYDDVKQQMKESENITFDVDTSGPLRLFLKRSESQTRISVEKVEEKRRNLLEQLNQKGKFDYPAIADRCLLEGKKLFSKMLGDKVEAINEIACHPVIPTGEDWSIRYETGFAAGGSEILFPDANTFSDMHIEIVTGHGYATREKLYLDYWYWCHIAILHEFVHCLQTACSLTDITGWALEHDASRLQAILPTVIIEALGYPKSFLYQIALHHIKVLNAMEALEPTIRDAEFLEKFENWKNSFGTHPPSELDSFAYNDENLAKTIYMKQRVAVEALAAQDGKDFCEIFEFMFSRSGDLMNDPQPKIPDYLKIPNEANSDFLRRPISGETNEKLINKLKMN